MEIPLNLLKIVASFLVKPRMKLLDWIPEDKIDWYNLSKNPNLLNAIHLLEKYPDKINWKWLSGNPNLLNAISLLEIVLQHDPDKINWNQLPRNSNSLQAIHILEANQNKIGCNLHLNPSIFEIDKKQYDIDINKKANNIDF